MALMTITEAQTGGEEAQARNAAQEKLDAQVAEVARRYTVQAGHGRFTFLALESEFADWATTTGTITDAGEMGIAGQTSNWCTLPVEAFIEYSGRRVFGNFCRRMKAAYTPETNPFDCEEIIAQRPDPARAAAVYRRSAASISSQKVEAAA